MVVFILVLVLVWFGLYCTIICDKNPTRKKVKGSSDSGIYFGFGLVWFLLYVIRKTERKNERIVR